MHTTVGYHAFLLILLELLKICNEEDRMSYDYYKKKLEPANEIDILDNNEPRKFPLTSKTISVLFNEKGAKILSPFTPRPLQQQ